MTAKSQETKIALLEQAMINDKQDHKDIKDEQGVIKKSILKLHEKLDTALETKADKEELIFWRNILVSGILMTIFLGIIGKFFS